MKWIKFRLKTISDAEDIIISALYEIGLEGAQIEDKVPLSAWEKEQMFVDIMPDEPDNDGIAYLNFFVEEEENKSREETIDKTIKAIEEKLEEVKLYTEIGEGSITTSETEDIDWINNWKEFFHQFYVDDLLVIPSWEEVKEEDKNKMILHIDPGTAFGTGMHETTQLCIRQLKKYVNKDTVLLDVGTGSGILAILSIMFGAKEAIGTDLDPCAIAAVEDNMQSNHIDADKFHLLIGNIISDTSIQEQVGYEKYDIVVANILAEVLLPLTPVIVRQMKVGGVYITSGIIDDKEETVVNAIEEAGLHILEITHQGEWVSITARREA